MENLVDYMPAFYMGIAPMVLAGLIAAGAGVAQGVLNRRHNKKLAEYQYSKDLEMWERQNQYNAPTAQMQRLKDAGLNPRMIYGTGASSAVGTARDMPRYQAPTVSENVNLASLMGVLSTYQDLNLRQAQIDNVRQKTETEKQITLIKDAEKMQSLWKVGKGVYYGKMPPAMQKYSQEVSRLALRNQYQEQLNKMATQGMFSRDPLWMRFFNQMLQSQGIDPARVISLRERR